MTALIVCVVLGACGLVGAWIAYGKYKETRPQAMWVELPLKQEVPAEKKDEVLAGFTSVLSKPGTTEKIAADLGLAAKWKLPNDQAAGAELAKRMFVRFGYVTNHPMGGHVPAIHIGVNGIVREKETSGKIAEAFLRVMATRNGHTAEPGRF